MPGRSASCRDQGEGKPSGLERGSTPAGLLGFRIDDLEARVCQLLLIIKGAAIQKFDTICSQKKADSVVFQGSIILLGRSNVHAIGKPRTSAFFNKEPETMLETFVSGKLADLSGCLWGDLDHGQSITLGMLGVKKPGKFHWSGDGDN